MTFSSKELRACIQGGSAGLAIAGAFISVHAAAQEAPARQEVSPTPEIVVTARSKAETLLEVPVAITAIGGSELAKYAASDLTKIAQMAPQLEIYTGGTGAGGAILIRGVGTTADTAGVDMSVSLNLDGTQVARPRTVYAGMFDLEQVAVLKGPQALFFGRNASAGVVSVQTANPTANLSGYVRGGYEFKARERYVEAAISVPISDTLGVRFAGRYSKLRGWTRNDAQGLPVDPFNPFENVALPGAKWRWGPGSENIGGRITVKWEPSDSYTSIMKASFFGYKDNGLTSTAEAICDTVPTVFGVWDGRSDCKLNGRTVQGALPPEYSTGPFITSKIAGGDTFSDMNAILLTWQQTAKLGDFQLQANTGYSDHKFELYGNFSGTEFVDFAGGGSEDYWAFSQELRLVSEFDGPFNFTIGGYYEKLKNKQEVNAYFFNVGRDPDTGSYRTDLKEGVEKSRVYSFFGQARYDVMDNLELAAGARYTKTKKSVVQGNARYIHQWFDPNFTPITATSGFLLPEGVLLRSQLSEDNWSPEATITWHPTPNQTLYAAFKTGYKSGGIALPAALTIADTAQSVTFKPEKAKGGEIGYKAALLNNRLKLEATTYYYIFKGLQLTSWDPTASSYKILNAADAKQYGLELSVAYRPNANFSFYVAGSYNHLDYKRFDTAPCWANQLPSQGCVNAQQDLTGQKLHRAPRLGANAGAAYDTNLTNDLMLGLSVDAKYTSSYFVSEALNPASKQDGFVLLSATARIYKSDDSWELSLIGRNLTNERVIGFVQDKSGAVTPGVPEVFAYGSRPREVALQGTLRF